MGLEQTSGSAAAGGGSRRRWLALISGVKHRSVAASGCTSCPRGHRGFISFRDSHAVGEVDVLRYQEGFLHLARPSRGGCFEAWILLPPSHGMVDVARLLYQVSRWGKSSPACAACTKNPLPADATLRNTRKQIYLQAALFKASGKQAGAKCPVFPSARLPR